MFGKKQFPFDSEATNLMFNVMVSDGESEHLSDQRYLKIWFVMVLTECGTAKFIRTSFSKYLIPEAW